MKEYIRLFAMSAAATCATALHAAIITVNTTNNNDFSAGMTNLVRALTNAVDGDTINFSISGTGPFYLETPALGAYGNGGYPNVTQNNLTIDGYSQPGSSPNSNTILASNNAAIKIVLDSRAGGCTTNFIDGEFGLDESGTLFVVGATNVHIRGLGFLGPGIGGEVEDDPSRYAIAIGSSLPGGAVTNEATDIHISGCWFGLDPGNKTNVYRFADGVAAFRGYSSTKFPRRITVGVAKGTTTATDARAQQNVIMGEFISLIIEGPSTRISGNRFNVYPDGNTEYNINGTAPRDIEAVIEIGRDSSNLVIGTDGDGNTDAEERNLFGGVTAANDNQILEWYSGNRTNMIVAGNYFGVGADGVTRFTNSMKVLGGFDSTTSARFGSDFDGVSDDIEGNVIFMNNPFADLFPTPESSSEPVFATLDAGARASFRGNKWVNNNLVPFTYADRNGGRLNNFTNYEAPFMDTNADIIPILSPASVFPRLNGTCALGVNPYTNIIIDVYQLDPEGWANGKMFGLQELISPDGSYTNGFPQGRKYLGSFVDNGPKDSNPAVGQFSLDLSGLDLGTGAVTVTANYSADQPGTHNGRVHTSNFSNPAYFIPGGTTSVGLTNIVSDTILWFDNTVNRPKLGGYVSTNAVAPGGSLEPYAGLLGDSTFLLSANTYAEDGVSMRFTVVFQPAAGGAAKIGDLFYDDRGQPYTNRINESRQDGNPGRVAGDLRSGATTFMGGGEVSLWNYPTFFNSDGRFDASSPFYSTLAAADVNGRDACVQTYSLDPSTLVQTMLSKAQDSAFGRCCTNASYPQTGNNQISRFGGHIQGLDNGNFVSVVEDRSGIFNPVSPSNGRASVATIFGPTGTIVKEAFAVDNTAEQWANVAAFSGGFCVRPSGDHLYFFNNAGTPQFTNSQNASSGLSLDTSRGDGTRIASDIRSHYVYLAGVSGGQVWLAIWNAQTGAFVTKAVVSDGDPSAQAFDRVNLAVDAWDRVCVVFKVRPVATDFPVFQTAARVLAFDGTNVTYLTHSFFPFVNHDESGTLDISTLEPTVAMTPREIFIAAKGVVNSTNNPSALGNTVANTDVYTIISHPDPKPTPGGGQLVITNLAISGPAVTISWTGGTGPYLLQKKTSLTDPTWQNVLTTQLQSESVALQGGAAFFRVSDHATNTVTPLTAFLSGDAERLPVTTGATALGSFSLEGNTLTYNITFSGLSGPATAAHIHGPTNTTGSIGVIIPFSPPAATSGTISGSTNVSDTIKGYLLSGLTYANIHTSLHGGGEIRGQIGQTQLKAALNGTNERPTPVVTQGTGTGVLTRIGNQLLFNITYSGLSSPATAAHVHGPADSSGFANVLLPLPTPSGTSGTISGSLPLDNMTLSAIVDGLSYVNIHTSLNGGGEIRGQITP